VVRGACSGRELLVKLDTRDDSRHQPLVCSCFGQSIAAKIATDAAVLTLALSVPERGRRRKSSGHRAGKEQTYRIQTG
jgi:hypothetical protein